MHAKMDIENIKHKTQKPTFDLINISYIRGLTEEITQLGMISPIGCFKSPIGDIVLNWGLVICCLTLSYQTHISPIPDWIYYPKSGI